MKKISRFFWYCSGIHATTLENYHTEHHKYVGIGATIFFTGLFAALSGGYAMYFVFKGTALAGLFAVVFGLIWGLAIFNMDRYIVSSINKSASTGKQMLQATPRILLAIMIGVVISRPLELKIFDKEIKERLKVSYLVAQQAKIDTLNKTFGNKYNLQMGQLADKKTRREALAATIKADRQKLNFEIFGNKTNETSGVMGYGPYAKRKEAELKKREADLDSLDGQIAKAQSDIDEKKQREGLMADKLYTGKQLDSLANIAGFADRNWALGQLSHAPNGKTDASTAMAVTFIGLLFIFFECLPVFVKLMSARGPYDFAVANIETVQIYQSDKDRDYEIAVTNEVHPHRVAREADRRKHTLNN